jgi:hypothetical protein
MVTLEVCFENKMIDNNLPLKI